MFKFKNRNKITVTYSIIWFFSTVMIVVFDQMTKSTVVKNMDLYQEINIINGFFKLYYVRNPGAGLGLLANARWVFMIFTTVVIVFTVLLLTFRYFKHPLANTSLVFILGGGIGNMIDRIAFGEVVDFFQFQIKYFDFIFNVADIFVTFGTVCFIIYYLFFYDKELIENDTRTE